MSLLRPLLPAHGAAGSNEFLKIICILQSQDQLSCSQNEQLNDKKHCLHLKDNICNLDWTGIIFLVPCFFF